MYRVNEEIRFVFRHDSGTTGIADGSWTKLLFASGAVASPPVTVTEIGSGFYFASFTPDEEADWYLDIIQTAAPTVRYTGHFKVLDIILALGGESFSSDKNLSSIKKSLNVVRDEQIADKSPFRYL